MKLVEQCMAALLAVADFIALSPFQRPLQDTHVGSPIVHASVDSPDYVTFPPPHFKDPEHDTFECEYPDYPKDEWESCSTPNNRQCWLRNKKTGKEFNITTDYEKYKPNGTTRIYNLTINRAHLNLDGVDMPHGVYFDDGNSSEKYPGPWIRACWGDTVIVNVKNNLTQWNGTTIHWHGIRQLNTMQMDGVNGVTQCPIAPNDSFQYKFETWQYGTSWYHSHYSLQYADGLVGPLTIYGPSSANWDEAKKPTLMTDWDHRSAFEDYSRNNWVEKGPSPAVMDSILLNGVGNFAGMHGDRRYNLTFVPGKRYLMRLINTAADTAFVFAIDGHNITVMSSDFVPIHPYTTDHVVIGIGQRYHVVIQAPTLEELEEKYPNKTLEELNFWIRTIPADGCSKFENGNKPDERQGIVRYDNASTIIPRTARGKFSDKCRDESPKNLRPVLSWNVGEAANNWTHKDYFEVGIQAPTHEEPLPMYGDFKHWHLGKTSLWLNFSDPSINHIEDAPEQWDKKAVIIPEDYPKDAWVYLWISGHNSGKIGKVDANRAFHPLHLHGHDFAILKQSNVSLTEENWREEMKGLNLVNPPRRDVVLLPGFGHVIIAFKADNPGVWIMHCHIAFHASGGLAMQILERQKDIVGSHQLGWKDQVDRGCAEWDKFYDNPENLWDKEDFEHKFFQDDSGI